MNVFYVRSETQKSFNSLNLKKKKNSHSFLCPGWALLLPTPQCAEALETFVQSPDLDERQQTPPERKKKYPIFICRAFLNILLVCKVLFAHTK